MVYLGVTSYQEPCAHIHNTPFGFAQLFPEVASVAFWIILDTNIEALKVLFFS